MTDLEKAARMALEALGYYEVAGLATTRVAKSITALRQALSNSVEQPAQQEPVATDWERIARVQDAKLRAMCDEPGGFEKLCEVMNRYERTLPPASKPWAGLTEKEKREARNSVSYSPLAMTMSEWTEAVQDATEAKLKEKNA